MPRRASLQAIGGGVEVGLQLPGLWREVDRDAMGQVAVGQMVKRFGQGADGRRVGLGLGGFFGLALGALGLGQPTLLDGLAFQPLLGDGGVLEAEHGVGHLADLVA
jgi:hypothetical protein